MDTPFVHPAVPKANLENAQVLSWRDLGLSSWKDIAFRTALGNVFYPLAPEDDLLITKIDIEDIAIGLSNKCRFNGHTDFFYSVAQHSVQVCDLMRVGGYAPSVTALLHDAAEYVLGDLNTLLKPLFPAFSLLEHRVQQLIYKSFGIELKDPEYIHAEIKIADRRAVLTEKRDLRAQSKDDVWEGYECLQPEGKRIMPLSPEVAKRLFLDRFVRCQDIV